MSTSPSDVASDLAPTGVLRAAINLANPVLAQGTVTEPGGLTVDLAREIGARLGLPVELVGLGAARESFAALTEGRVDLCFLAVEPVREAEVAFTAPYVVIEGVYAVRRDVTVTGPDDVDRPGVRVGVNRGSAYDLFLSRSLEHAELVRGDDGTVLFEAEGLEAVAGIRQAVTAYAAARAEVRLVEERFMEIRQAVGTTRTRRPATLAFLHAVVEELKAGGWVTEALRRSGQADAAVAPAAPPASGPGPLSPC